MEKIELNVESTQASGQLYLDVDDYTCLVPKEQKDSELGKIFIVPEFENEDDVNVTPLFPRYSTDKDIYIYWYTFYYLMAGKAAPPKVEKHYLSIAS